MPLSNKPGRAPIRGAWQGITAQNVPKPVTLHMNPARTAKVKGRINLKAVADVLAERGLDPTEQILAILCPTDENGNQVQSGLDADVQARIWNELLQYTQPKLKSVEVKGNLTAQVLNFTPEQSRAIAEEFLASQGFSKT
jgi:hypothetical protein